MQIDKQINSDTVVRFIDIYFSYIGIDREVDRGMGKDKSYFIT